jgi:hypothetical protein
MASPSAIHLAGMRCRGFYCGQGKRVKLNALVFAIERDIRIEGSMMAIE